MALPVPYPALSGNVNAPSTTPPPPPAPAAPKDPATQYGPLSNDPGLIAALNQQQAGDANAAALLNQLRQTQLYRFNGAGNPYSTLAQLHQSDADATRAYMNNLAARGILSSGETGYQQGQEAKRYGTALYGAQNNLSDLLNSYMQQYLGTLNSDAGGVTAATNQAWQNYMTQLATGSPGAYGYWNQGTLPSGIKGYVPVNPQSAAQNQITGGSLLASGLFK